MTNTAQETLARCCTAHSREQAESNTPHDANRDQWNVRSICATLGS